MTKMNYTPRPWRLERPNASTHRKNGDFVPHYIKEGNRTIVCIRTLTERDRADAKLISVAPEMLKLLKKSYDIALHSTAHRANEFMDAVADLVAKVEEYSS